MSEVTVTSWGNSQGIRIPKAVLDRLNIHVSDTLQMDVKNDTIVLRKKLPHKSFEERLADYNGEISVYSYDWGEPEGREII